MIRGAGVRHGAVQVAAFVAGALALVRFGWPRSLSGSAVSINRMLVVGTLVLLAVLPSLVRRYTGPLRAGWAARVARVGSAALVLTLVAAMTTIDRFGSPPIDRFFVAGPVGWVGGIVLLLVIAGYVAAPVILTSRSVRLSRSTLLIGVGLGALTAGVLYASAPFGVDAEDPALRWWVLTALALPVATGMLAARLCAPDTGTADVEAPAVQGWTAAICASATAALLVAVFTSVTIAVWPHRVPLQHPAPPAGGGCETCEPNGVVVPPELRGEYWVDISVRQAALTADVGLLIVPVVGVVAGAYGGAAGAALRRRSGTVSAAPRSDEGPLRHPG